MAKQEGAIRPRTMRNLPRRRYLSPVLTFLMMLHVAKANATSSTNFYRCLGVSKTCTEGDLKKAYRKQCLKHHPDKGGDEETFKNIQKAYDCLSDPEKKNLYDQYGEAGLDGGGAGAGATPFTAGSNPFTGGSNPFGGGSSPFGGVPPQFGNMFGSGFSFGGPGGSTSSTGGFDVNLDSILRDMMGGPSPGGSQFGRQFGSNQPQQPSRTYTRPLKCSLEELYNGTTKKLKVSFGSKSKIFTIQVKPGWKAGTKVKYPPSSSFPGITFLLEEKGHKLFRRDGNDLVYRHRLRPSSSPVTIEFPLPDGIIWKRSIPAKSPFLKAGRRLSIPDKGMPIKGGPERGNLIIEFY